ncbi:AAA family ATPase [Crocinitomicaceae bacterium]|nr:AAA family ATPase [Crocinitomicaceae bacterium]
MKKTIMDFLHFDCPTQEQKTVLNAIQKFTENDNTDDFIIMCGAAGTGKTSVVSSIIGYLDHINKNYKIAAPTGRAARIIGRKSKCITSTIHSMIYIPESDKSSGNVSFKLKPNNEKEITYFIVDEASMISKSPSNGNALFQTEKGLLDDLLSFIKDGNTKNKIIFIGDHYQLPPINENKSFALNEESLKHMYKMKGSSYELTEVKRQDDGSYILKNATEIREAIDLNKKHHEIRGNSNRNVWSATQKYAREYKQNGPGQAVAINVSHKQGMMFNELVRKNIFGESKRILQKGDLLMVNRNWTRNEEVLYNGDHVELLDVDWNLQENVAGLNFVAVKIKRILDDNAEIIEDYAIIETLVNPGGALDPRKEKELRRSRFAKNKILRETSKPSDDRYIGALHLVYGHAITCNKAQGGEWDKVYINTFGIPNLRWQYTAVTRGINEIEKF